MPRTNKKVTGLKYRCAHCTKRFCDDVRLSHHVGSSINCKRYYECLSSRPLFCTHPGSIQQDEHLDGDRQAYTSADYMDSPLDTHHGKRPRVSVEEIGEDDANNHEYRWEKYPRHTAECLGEGIPKYTRTHDHGQRATKPPYAPYNDKDEWELAKWMMKNLTH
jgi:hypothetical protein